MISVAYKKLVETAQIPTYATEWAAGADLYMPTDEHIVLQPCRVTKIGTGIAISIPRGFEGQVRSRSGLASRGVWVANGVGTIDADYRGEVIVMLYNSTDSAIELPAGSRIAQIVFNQFDTANFCHWSAQDDKPTKRGTGGIGSTGV